MALDMNDLMALKGLENNGGMSPYEQVKIGHMQTRGRASGVGIAGLVLGCVGTVAGVTAWIFSPLYASSKAKEAKEAAQAAKEIAAVRGEATQRQLDQIAALLAAERTERISGDVTLNQTITDTVSGSQQGNLTAQQQAEEYLNILESVRWDNYLTEKEAETVVSAMSPAPKWTRQQWLKYMEQSGEGMEHYPCYNRCALYATMCMIDSDDGETIAMMMGKEGVATNDMDYFAMVYQFALNKLKDHDGVFNIRRYFKDVLWPEKKQSR